MTGRQFFTEAEKLCLSDLIVKYQLNTEQPLNVKRLGWARLTEEFNSLEGNSKRSEAQLKKLWDNLKTRKRQALYLEKKKRWKSENLNKFNTSQEDISEDNITNESLDDFTDTEMRFVCDIDPLTENEGVSYEYSEVVNEGFNLRNEQYTSSQKSDELYKIKVAEQEWHLKAAEELYHKARLERESAAEILRFNRARREEAELRLEILKRNVQK